MNDRVPKIWAYLLILLVLVVGGLIAARIFWPFGDSESTPLQQQEWARELDEKEREIQEKDRVITRLRDDLEEASKKSAALQARLDENAKTLSTTQQRLKDAERELARLAQSRAAPPPQRPAPRPAEPPPARGWRSPAEPGTYEIVRTTPVLEQPSESSRMVSTINRGTRVEVIGSRGDWLEVRSKHGNPPGFIRREDAMFIDRN